MTAPSPHADDNPFAEPHWDTPYGLPPFERIAPAHFARGFDEALRTHEAAIAAIAGTPEPPGFANTIGALERAGRDLDRPRLPAERDARA